MKNTSLLILVAESRLDYLCRSKPHMKSARGNRQRTETESVSLHMTEAWLP